MRPSFSFWRACVLVSCTHVQCGSAMYGVALPTSDADFHLVYLAPPTDLLALSSYAHLRKLHFSRAVGAPYGAAAQMDGAIRVLILDMRPNAGEEIL